MYGAGGTLKVAASNHSSTSYVLITDKVEIGGNCGIGTNNPQRKLVVSDDGTEGFEFFPGDSVNGGTLNLYNRVTAAFVPLTINSQDFRWAPSGGTEAFRINSSGNVGINSTSPADLLTIGAGANTLAFGAKDTTRGNHIWQLLNNDASGNAEFRMYKNSVSGTHEQAINFATSGDDNYLLYGDLGIGLANPTQPVTIARSSAGQAEFGVRFQYTDTSGGGTLTNSAVLVGSYGLKFKNYNSSRNFLFETGKVGIGTDNPAVLLEVEDTIDVAFDADNSVVVANNILRLENKASNGFAGMMFRTGGGGDAHFGSYQNASSANDCTFYFSNQIDSGGGQILATLDSATGDFIVNKGSVGIGTVTPINTLHLHGKTSGVGPILQLSNDTGDCRLFFGTHSTTADANAQGQIRYNVGNNYLAAYTAGSERVRITSAGKLVVATNINQTVAFDYAGVYFTSDNSTTADGLFLNNTAANTGDNVSLSFSTDSGNRKKSAISHVDTGDYGRGDLVFSIDPDADSGELDIQAHEKLRIKSDGKVAIGGNAQALRLTVRGSDSIDSGANEGTVSNAIAMFYGGSRNTIVADKEIIDTTILHIKGQILDTEDTDNTTTGTHATGKIVFSGRRATGAQSIIESSTVWNRALQTAGSELKFYTAPTSANGGDAAVERLKISNSGYMQMKNSAGSTFALLRNAAVADSSSLLGAVEFGSIDWDSSVAQISAYQDGAKDKASLRFYTQPSVGSGIQERLRITSTGYREIRNFHYGPWAFTNNTAKTTITVGDPGASKFTTVKLLMTIEDVDYRQGYWQGEYTIFASNATGAPGVDYHLHEHWQQTGSTNWSGGSVSVAITSGGALQVTADNGHDDAQGNVWVHILDVIGDIDGTTVAAISA